MNAVPTTGLLSRSKSYGRMEFCSHVWWVWRAAPWPDVDLRPHLPITLMSYKKEIIMETLLIMIMLFIVLDMAPLRWRFDSII